MFFHGTWPGSINHSHQDEAHGTTAYGNPCCSKQLPTTSSSSTWSCMVSCVHPSCDACCTLLDQRKTARHQEPLCQHALKLQSLGLLQLWRKPHAQILRTACTVAGSGQTGTRYITAIRQFNHCCEHNPAFIYTTLCKLLHISPWPFA